MFTSASIAVTGARRLAASRPGATRGVATFTRSYPSFHAGSSASCRPPTAAAFFQQSFHPSIAASLAEAESGHNTGQRRWKSLIAAAALAGIVSVYSLSSIDRIQLDAAPPSAASSVTSITADASKQVVVDADTNLSFPLYIPTPASFATSEQKPKLRLVGLGVRTVSFLRVRVYVAALYIDESALGSSASATTLEAYMKETLDQGTAAVIRIVPVRNTDFNHLRDGFIRALQGRLKKAIKQSQIDSAAETSFQEQIQGVKDSFPRGSVPKGSPLDLVIVPVGKQVPVTSELHFEYDGEVFGQVKGGLKKKEQAEEADRGFTVARELVLAYFADQGEISPPFKKSVEQALLQTQLPASQ